MRTWPLVFKDVSDIMNGHSNGLKVFAVQPKLSRHRWQTSDLTDTLQQRPRDSVIFHEVYGCKTNMFVRVYCGILVWQLARGTYPSWNLLINQMVFAV